MERICRNCCYWQPNGSPLGVGYCMANQWSYRKPGQTCKTYCPALRVVLEHYDAGWTPERIAEEYGLDASLVAQAINIKKSQTAK